MLPDETGEYAELDENDDPNLDSEEESDVEEDITLTFREDKIFNNRYNTGEGLSHSDEYTYSNKISVSLDYSDAYLKDLYEYEESLENSFILDTIFKFIQTDEIILNIIERSTKDSNTTRLKLSKEEVNIIFSRINEKLEIKSSVIMFYSPIYIVEVIASLSSIEYRKLFDMFDTEIQELLLIELNKKYKFLEGKMHKKRIH